MAMILDAFVGRYVDKLSEFVEGEMSMMLGVKDELKKLQRRMERISGFLESAEHKRHANQSIDTWLRELKDIMYDADDIIDRCMIEGRKLLEDHPSESAVRRPLSLFSCFNCIKFRHEIGSEIIKLNDRLKEIAEDQAVLPSLEYTRQDVRVSGVNHRQTFSIKVKSDVVGTQLEEDTQSLVESLIKENNKKYRVLGIVGMGGIGKTTLASNVYNDERMKDNFPIRVWVCVSQDFSETELLKEIIRGANGNYGEAKTKAELVPCLSSTLSKRFFIVLDDVWKIDVWEDLLRYSFESATAGGRIVITTRNTNVPTNIRAEIHHVDKMNNDNGWKLLCKKVFGDDDDEEEEISSLKEIGVQIVEKCDGLPLAIKAIAGVLSTKGRTRTEWVNVLESDAWSMSKLDKELPKALFLSYKDLSSDLKQCFLYCSLFPEDCVMHCDDLVRLWVAEGFIERTRGHLLMEDLAKDNYGELIRRNLLQLDQSKDDDRYCRMHDLLRTLALSLMGDESIFLGDEQSLKVNSLTKIRRLSMNNTGERVKVPDAIKQQKCLRTLLLWTSPQAKIDENELFGTSRLLRVIHINDTKLGRIRDSIGDLLHLRYLNLEKTNIKELPESIGCLANLQMLNLSGCAFLHTLPKAITKLCNLRCLRLGETPLTHVPKGIGKLKHLNHLEGFVVGHDDRRDVKDEECCDLDELRSLSLRFLSISRLERARQGGAPVLANSRSLSTLILDCKPGEDEEDVIAVQGIDEIYNELTPQSTCLQSLVIDHFFGTGFPCWIMSPSLDLSFPDLTKIILHDCKSCPQVPPLGLLPRLKYLSIHRAYGIKSIGPEFLGLRASSVATSFPKLEELEFYYMSNWEEWSFGMVEGVGEERRGGLKLLPRLSKLELRYCSKLRALPPLGLLPELKFLDIMNADAIKTIGPEFLGPCASSAATSFPKLEELHFLSMSSWEEWSFGMVEGVVGEERKEAPKLLPHLRILRIRSCPNMRALPPLGLLPELKYLHISDVLIETIGPEFLGPRASSEATSFPKLEELILDEMYKWEGWSFGMVEGVGEERREAPKLLPRLVKLKIWMCPKLRALPEGLRHVTSLQELNIWRDGDLKEINNLPFLTDSLAMVQNWNLERVSNLPSLKSLKICDCPRLEYVENLDRLQRLEVVCTEQEAKWLLELLGHHPLQNLQTFDLTCRLPLLETFLKDRPNWPIIQRIPQVSIKEYRGASYLLYTKDPPTFKSEVFGSEKSEDR